MTKKNKRRGFTVVELVIVIAVIAILAAVLIPTYVNLVKKANEAKAQAEAKNLITEMLADILLGKEGDADLLVFSEKGSDVYAYAYSRTEGKIIAYKNNPTAKTGSFEDTVQSILTTMGDAITDCNVAEDDWRHPNKIKAVVNELNTKGTMIVYANYTINADKFAVHVHNFGAWENAGETVGHRHTCSCGATETEAHKWDNGVVTKEATATESGTKTYTCTICNATKTETIAPAGHTHSAKTHHTAVPASCITDGSIEYWECECGAKFSDEGLTKQISDPKVKALGHDWGNWGAGESSTCEAGGTQVRTCKRCSAQDTRTTSPAGHKIVTIPAVAATCITDGKTEGTECSVCHKVITPQTVIPATGHSWGEWTYDNETNHTRKCKNCTATENHGHNIVDGKCNDCGHVFNTDVKDAAGLIAAIKAAKPGDTIRLGADITGTSKFVISKELTIDLNGHALSNTAYQTLSLKTGANVTIIDSSDGQNGIIKNEYTKRADPTTIDLYSNGVIFTLKSGKVQSSSKDDLYCIAIGNSQKFNCTVNIYGGTVANCDGHERSRAITASNGMTVNIYDGIINGGLYSLDVYAGSVSNIFGGTLLANAKDGRTDEYGTSYAIHAKGQASITIGSLDIETVPTVKGIKFESSGVKTELPTIKLVKGKITNPIYSMEAKYNYPLFKLDIVADAPVTFTDDTAKYFLADNLQMTGSITTWTVTSK